MNKKVYNAYIRWFDNLAGEGFVRVPELDEKSIYVHYSADERSPAEFITYESNDPVEVTVLVDSHYTQIDFMRPSNWTTSLDIKKGQLADRLVRQLEEGSDDLVLVKTLEEIEEVPS